MPTLTKFFSRKSLFCICLGVYFVISGVASLQTPESVAQISKDYGYKATLEVMSLHNWSLFFIFIGTISILFAFTKKLYIAFGILQALSFWWASLFILNAFQTHYWNSLTLASVDLLLVFLLGIVSSWPEPVTPVMPVKTEPLFNGDERS